MSSNAQEEDFVVIPYREANTIRELNEAPTEVLSEIILGSPSGREVSLPHSVRRVLEQAVYKMTRGNAVRVLTVKAELSTQQAADLLNMSRPHLMKLLARGDLSYHRAGSHPRILLKDLLVYKERRQREKLEALDEITRISDELRLYNE